MISGEQKQRVFYNRAQHRLREVEASCREIITLSKTFNGLAEDISDSELNTRKLEILKSEIKDKLREFANNIDEVYKILDRKIVIIMKDISKYVSSPGKTDRGSIAFKHGQDQLTSMGQESNMNDRCFVGSSKEQGELSDSSKGQGSLRLNAEGLFSDTLNPRVSTLEAKIAEYQLSESSYRKTILELKQQNSRLIEELDRLSSASGRTINELKAEITELRVQKNYQQNQAKINNLSNFNNSFNNSGNSRPVLNLTNQTNTSKLVAVSPLKNKKSTGFFEREQNSRESIEHFYEDSQLDYFQPKVEKSLLNFGCMPSLPVEQRLSLVNAQMNETLDRNDRNRRWDLMLNKLRTSQQESTEGSRQEGESMESVQERGGGVMNLVRRHKI